MSLREGPGGGEREVGRAQTLVLRHVGIWFT